MIRRTFIAAGVFTAAASVVESLRRRRAQTMCSALPNPIVVTGSADFEPVLAEFAVRLAAESPPITIVTVSRSERRRNRAPASGASSKRPISAGCLAAPIHATGR